MTDYAPPLYHVLLEHVFTGNERILLFRAPSDSHAKMVAEAQLEPGEFVQDMNFAAYMDGIPLQLIDITWKTQKPMSERIGREPKHRKLRITRTKK